MNLPSWLADLLVCPFCGGDLRLQSPSEPARDPVFVCSCGRSFPVREGVPRFVESDAYVSSFSFEWDIHRRTQFDENTAGASTRRFVEVTGVRPEELHSQTVLDAGVGTGRFADVVSSRGARVVGLDLSYAVDVARENMGHRENVGLVHGDICAPPFRPECFDFIYSIGVLHHTPDAERAFRSLVPLLKRGGSIAVYLYPRDASSRISDVYRRFTVRLPKRLLYLLCHLAGPLYYLGEIPVAGPVFRFVMPISRHPKWRLRVLDTFDWYSPRYQSKHTYPEVFRWFRTSGLADVELMDIPVCVRGRKPAA